MYCGEPGHIAQRCPNERAFKVQSIEPVLTPLETPGKQGCIVTVRTIRLDTRNPTKRKGHSLPSESRSCTCFTIMINIKVERLDIYTEALIDISIFVCFMDEKFVHQQKIEVIRKKILTPVEVIDGQPLALSDVL